MMKRLLLPILALGLGVVLLTTVPSPAAPASAEQIEKLIKEMGSTEFEDREKAQGKLDEIGEPALEALKKAMTSDDTEIRRRSEELVKKIEQRTASTKTLKATKIHLVFKDTPVAEAVAEIRKKTGYNITLHDPENKLKDRKVTVDTGEVTFWEAFDKFCVAANLVDAKPEDLIQKVQPGNPGPGVNPGGPNIQPVPPEETKPVKPIKPGVRPLPAEKDSTPQPTPQQRQLNRTGALMAAEEAPQQAQAQQAQADAKQAQAQQGQAQPGRVQVQPAQPGGGAVVRPPIGRPGVVQVQPGQIILVDGKPAKEMPTDYSSAVRVRAMEKNDMFGPAGEGQMLLGLEVSPEPKLTWQNLIGVQITKVVDDKDQALAQGATDIPNGPNVGIGVRGPNVALPIRRVGFSGVHQQIPVYIKKGEKASKSLKEISGVIKADVLSEPKAVITTDDVFKSANKTFKGGEKGEIKIIEATKAENGQVQVKIEMTQPQDYVPAGGNGVGVWGQGGGFGGGGIQIQPLPPMPIQPGIQLPQGFQVQAVQVQQIQIQVQGNVQVIQAQPAIAVLPARVGNGLSAIDDKGNAIPVTLQQRAVKDPNNPNGIRVETVAIFQLEKGQDVAKLVWSGSKSVTVEVPFTLKNVTLP
jgi:hypothetical protein